MWCGSWSPDDTNWANVSDAIRRELDGEAFHDGGFWIGFQAQQFSNGENETNPFIFRISSNISTQ